MNIYEILEVDYDEMIKDDIYYLMDKNINLKNIVKFCDKEMLKFEKGLNYNRFQLGLIIESGLYKYIEDINKDCYLYLFKLYKELNFRLMLFDLLREEDEEDKNVVELFEYFMDLKQFLHLDSNKDMVIDILFLNKKGRRERTN